MWTEKQIRQACANADFEEVDIDDIIRALKLIDTDEGKKMPVKPVNVNSEHHRVIESMDSINHGT